MLIYNKLEDSIDIYNMEAKTEEIKKYRKRIIQKSKKQEPLFYYLRTNCLDTIKSLENASNININSLVYDNNTPLDYGTYSDLYEIHPVNLDNKQEKIIEAYLAGYYDNLPTTKIFQFNWKNEEDEELYRLLKPKNYHISSTNSHGNVYEIDDMLNLPRNLYLLHQLLQGRYSRVADENIAKLLKLFEFDYQRNIKLKEIEEIIETGLITDSMDQVIKKVETSSKVYQKAKKK